MQYLFEDRPNLGDTALPDYDTLDIISHGCHLYGEILWPDGRLEQPRPCVILLHGFPGSARNDDLAHALCRVGCVVLIPHHRGAWGSEGEYLISNCLEDAIAIADSMHGSEFCRHYHIDPECIYLIGHSMVDRAEQLLLDLGFHQVLVRIHGMIARIEVLPEEFQALLSMRTQISDTFRHLGFSYVTLDLEGYRTGSMNETLLGEKAQEEDLTNHGHRLK